MLPFSVLHPFTGHPAFYPNRLKIAAHIHCTIFPNLCKGSCYFFLYEKLRETLIKAFPVPDLRHETAGRR